MISVAGKEPESAMDRGGRQSMLTLAPASARTAERPPESVPRRPIVSMLPYGAVFLLLLALGVILWWTA